MQNELKTWLNPYTRHIRFLTCSFLALLLYISCDSRPEIGDTSPLNGYWTIEKVVLADGSVKEYSLSPTVDYFQLKDSTGYRKKVQPQLDGTYLTSDDAIGFRVRLFNDRHFLYYSIDEDSWTEEIRLLNSEKLVLVSADEIAYHYVRFTPITLEQDGKGNQ